LSDALGIASDFFIYICFDVLRTIIVSILLPADDRVSYLDSIMFRKAFLPAENGAARRVLFIFIFSPSFFYPVYNLKGETFIFGGTKYACA